jgi:hypothetical protein
MISGLNPIEWKREHQVALAGAAAIGCLGGLIFGLAWSDTFSWFQWGELWCDRRHNNCFYLLNGYWLRIIFWTALGGSVGAALVYIRQLLRS